jgi:hypothetical protein
MGSVCGVGSAARAELARDPLEEGLALPPSGLVLVGGLVRGLVIWSSWHAGADCAIARGHGIGAPAVRQVRDLERGRGGSACDRGLWDGMEGNGSDGGDGGGLFLRWRAGGEDGRLGSRGQGDRRRSWCDHVCCGYHLEHVEGE